MDDPLKRYLLVPNRMLFLYSSEDTIISSYLDNHSLALNGLSGDVCDIYVSACQKTGEEDVYSFRKLMPHLPQINNLKFSLLPALLLWSNSTSLVITLHDIADDTGLLRRLFRFLFELLQDIARPIQQSDHERIFDLISKLNKKRASDDRIHVVNFGELIMSRDQYVAKEGSNILVNSTAHDISASNVSSVAVDLPELASQLKKLRIAMKAEAERQSADHDIEIGQIAQIEAAAGAGKIDRARDAAKNIGKWVLEVGEKIGVDFAVSFLKESTGL